MENELQAYKNALISANGYILAILSEVANRYPNDKAGLVVDAAAGKWLKSMSELSVFSRPAPASK